jgi:hypothetical protein
MTAPPFGMLAEFDEPEALTRAVRAAKDAGYTRLDAFAPFPVQDVADELGAKPTIIPWITLVAAFVGAAIQYYSQHWMNAVDYPLNVGGRPLESWPAFIPATIIVAILWGGAATLLGLLMILRLPRLHHPLFEVESFARASEDRFFLCILSDDPRFAPGETEAFLGGLRPLAVREVPRCE